MCVHIVFACSILRLDTTGNPLAAKTFKPRKLTTEGSMAQKGAKIIAKKSRTQRNSTKQLRRQGFHPRGEVGHAWAQTTPNMVNTMQWNE